MKGMIATKCIFVFDLLLSLYPVFFRPDKGKEVDQGHDCNWRRLAMLLLSQTHLASDCGSPLMSLYFVASTPFTTAFYYCLPAVFVFAFVFAYEFVLWNQYTSILLSISLPTPSIKCCLYFCSCACICKVFVFVCICVVSLQIFVVLLYSILCWPNVAVSIDCVDQHLP